MKEEIYIDGVNVAKCEYYYRCDCKIDDDTDINLCKWHDDCYYKQLKRLEQENEELKSLNKKICEDCSKEIKVYWNAFEEIRKINNKWLKRWRDDSDELAGFEEIENKINEVL